MVMFSRLLCHCRVHAEVDDKSPVPSGLQTDAKVYQITVLPKVSSGNQLEW